MEHRRNTNGRELDRRMSTCGRIRESTEYLKISHIQGPWSNSTFSVFQVS
jgi:hypothetical protein